MQEEQETERSDNPAQATSGATSSLCLEESLDAFPTGEKLALEGSEGGRIGFGPSPNDYIDGRNPLQDVQADDLPESSLQLITLYDGATMLGNDEAYAGMMQKGSDDSELEILEPNPLPFS